MEKNRTKKSARARQITGRNWKRSTDEPAKETAATSRRKRGTGARREKETILAESDQTGPETRRTAKAQSKEALRVKTLARSETFAPELTRPNVETAGRPSTIWYWYPYEEKTQQPDLNNNDESNDETDERSNGFGYSPRVTELSKLGPKKAHEEKQGNTKTGLKSNQAGGKRKIGEYERQILEGEARRATRRRLRNDRRLARAISEFSRLVVRYARQRGHLPDPPEKGEPQRDSSFSSDSLGSQSCSCSCSGSSCSCSFSSEYTADSVDGSDGEVSSAGDRDVQSIAKNGSA